MSSCCNVIDSTAAFTVFSLSLVSLYINESLCISQSGYCSREVSVKRNLSFLFDHAGRAVWHQGLFRKSAVCKCKRESECVCVHQGRERKERDPPSLTAMGNTRLLSLLPVHSLAAGPCQLSLCAARYWCMWLSLTRAALIVISQPCRSKLCLVSEGLRGRLRGVIPWGRVLLEVQLLQRAGCEGFHVIWCFCFAEVIVKCTSNVITSHTRVGKMCKVSLSLKAIW